MANEVTKFTINGVQHDVMDVGARQLIASVQAALNAITSGDTTTAIKTFQEVIDFLDGVTDDATLVGTLNELRTLINGKYAKPANGIPLSDLVQSVQNILSDVANKVDKETGKGLSTNDYTTEEKTKLAGLPTNPVKSITVNGTAQQKDTNGNVNIEVEGADGKSAYQSYLDTTSDNPKKTETQWVASLKGATGAQGPKGDRGDLNITEGTTPVLSIISDMDTPDDEQDNIKVLSAGVGYNLGRAMLTAMEVPQSPVAGCTYYDPTANSDERIKMYYIDTQDNNTLKHIDTAPSTKVIYCDMSSDTTYRYDGAGMVQIGGGGGVSYSEDANTIYLTIGNYVDNIPSLNVSDSSVRLSPSVGGTATKTITVVGRNLTQGITATLQGNTSGFFSVSPASLGVSGGTLTVTYAPTAEGTHTASLVISSSEIDEPITVSLNGVATQPTITATPASLTLKSQSGNVATGTIHVEGSSLAEGITVAVSGQGFAVDTQSISAEDAVNGVDIEVTFTPTSGSPESTASGSLTLSSSGATSVNVALSYETAVRKSTGDTFTNANAPGLTFTVLTNTNNVSAKSNAASGEITIPSSVTDEGGISYNVTNIPANAFSGRTGITAAHIPSSVTSIGDNAFSGCTGLTQLDIADVSSGSLSLGASFITGCTSLKKLLLPNRLSSVNAQSFWGCSVEVLQIGTSKQSKTVDFAKSLFDGGDGHGALSLKCVICFFSGIKFSPGWYQLAYGGGLPAMPNGNCYRNYQASNPKQGTNIDTAGTGRLYVPDDFVNTYKSAEGWENLNNGGFPARIYDVASIGTISGYETDARLDTNNN